MSSRERRAWTEVEDDLLRSAVQQEDADSHPPTKWRAIAKHVPSRNNKDCRKRWFAKMASPVARGGWSAVEDRRLVDAIRTYGTRWSLVAATVGTRNNNQCAKRWGDTLSPDIDRTAWTPEEDAQLLAAVVKQGTLWAQIVKMYFPRRTGLSAKNRHARLSRTSADLIDGELHHRTGRRRSSPLPPETFLASRSSSQPEKPHPPSADYSDTTSTPGSSSSSLIIDRPSQTAEQECPRSMIQLDDGLSSLPSTLFQIPSYCRSETTEQANKALMFAGPDLSWGNSPTLIPEFLRPHMVQRQASDHRPPQTGQCASNLLNPQFFNDRSSLYPQPACNIPSTLDFSHTPQLACKATHVRAHSTNDIQEQPPPLTSPTFPQNGTPDFSLFTLPPYLLGVHALPGKWRAI